MAAQIFLNQKFNFMRKIFSPLAFMFVCSSIFAQVDWNSAGNTTGVSTTNNIIGTQSGFNFPIRFWTDGLNRMKLNQTVSYVVNNGSSLSRDGYLLIGQNSPIATQGNVPIYNTGAFSLLHLNGDTSALAGGIDGLGHRDWMKTGITFTGNGDLSYIGLRAASDDVTETVISWADDGAGTAGPDDLVFRFLGGADADAAISGDLGTPFDGDGLHIARFVPTGQIGFGNTFDVSTRPQNLLHMSLDSNKAVWLQITNRNGTGQTTTDGLQIGLPATSGNNLEAQINQRENDRLSLFSNNSERVRIMHTDALNNGVAFNPGGLASNLTRIGISHDPATPVTRPLSLLHLGYNVANATSNDGWRSWMDVGMFASQGSDHVYLGLDTSSNGADAVLAWGDNQPGQSGPDNFKILFTATSNPGLGLPAEGQNGLEGLRMTPNITINGLNVKEEIYTGIGGDAANGNPYHGSSANPTAT